MRWIVRALAAVGLLFIIVLGLAIFGLSRLHIAGRAPAPITGNAALTLTVNGPFTEEATVTTGLSALTGHARKLRDVIDDIDHAAADGRIKGLVIKIDASAGMAQSQELRAAVGRFRNAGKFAYAFAADYGEGAAGNGEYYLASACDQIWLQPMGDAIVAGIVFEEPFFKDALAKLGVDPEFVKRSEYKTAPETFTEHGFTPAAREMMESLANDLTLQLVTGIADSRKLQPDQVRAILARGPLTADEAVEAKLVDHIGYADEIVAAAKTAAGGDARTVSLGDYHRDVEARGLRGKANIALIYEVGDIGDVGGPIDPGSREDGLRGEDAVMFGFSRAMADPDIKSIIFRVDSPGGSVAGSESIRRMVVRAKAAGKKVIVSMGATAASGGYWVSADADKIVADPATLTGSIGVFSGKFVVGKGLADWGVTVDRTADGGFAGIDSPFTPYSPEQTQRLNATIDVIYDGFVARVAEGRKLPAATVAQLAKGRVWTGQQAKQLGLVDELGGLYDAVRFARELGGIGPDQPTMIRVYPEPLSRIEAIRELIDDNTDDAGAASSILGRLDGPAGAAVKALAPLFRDPEGNRVRMPDLGEVK